MVGKILKFRPIVIEALPVDPEPSDFGDRLHRIRASLEKINKLMTELKQMSGDDDV